MRELVKFFPPKGEADNQYKFLLPACVILGLLGYFLLQQDRYSLLGDGASLGAVACGVLGAAQYLAAFFPPIWLTPEGIHCNVPKRKSNRVALGFYRWDEPIKVVPDSKSKGVLLLGSPDIDGIFLVPGFVLTDPAFRAALVRWAPPEHPLFAYLPKLAESFSRP